MRVSWFDERGIRVTGTDSHPGYRAFLAKQEATRTLKNVSVDRVDVVVAGANQGATIQLIKSEDVVAAETLAKAQRKAAKKLAKANAESARTGDTGTAPGIGAQTSPALPTQTATTPKPTLAADPLLGDQRQGESPDIGPGPDPLGEIVRRLDAMVARGAITRQQADIMYVKQKIALGRPATSGETAWTQSDSIGLGKGYLSPERARENVSRPTDELELRKALRRRETQAMPLSKAQGLLIAARVVKGLSQAQVARATGLSKSLLSMLESGQAPVSGSVALRLSEAYGLTGADGLQWCREVTRPKTEG